MNEKYENLMIISESLGNLYEDGIQFSNAFEIMSEIHLSNKYKQSMKIIRNKILQGFSLSEAFSIFPKLYPKFFVGIIAIGENTGELSKILESLHKYYTIRYGMRKEISNALFYPIFICISMFIVFLIIFFIVIPSMYETIKSINKTISPVLETFYAISKWIVNNKFISLIALVSWITAIILIFKYLKKLMNMENSKLMLSIRVIREYYEYIFILILSIIMESSIPLIKGLDLSMNSNSHNLINKELLILNQNILRGMDLSSSLIENKFLSKYSLSLISIGENSGDLTKSLVSLENRLQKRLQDKIKKLTALVTPIFIAFMSVIVFIFIYVLIVPIINSMYSGVGV
ncbi:MAG: type II secretion system F family protein [Clostridiaceae bacterium]|nr:type II secretion system F family protein [Clostridiaceae bacterium]